MSILAEFVVPADEFVLAETLADHPEVRVEIKRVVGGTEHVTPYFWVTSENFESFERSLHEDEMTREVLILEDQAEDERFYRVTWVMEVPNLITAVSDAKATILEAESVDGGRWEIKVLFPDEPSLSTFQEYATEHGFSFEVGRLYRPENPQEQAEYGVTDDQQEALEAAYHAGYFKVPRDITLTELADDIGISRNALSARLRRGQDNLLENTLVHEE